MPTPPDFTNGTKLDASSLAAIGLWKITAQTLTAVSSTNYLRIQNAFSADFDNYRLIINGTGSGAASIVVRLGNAGTAAQTNYYYALPYWYHTAGADGIVRSAGAATSMSLGFINTVRTSTVVDIFRPFDAETTQFAGSGVGQSNTTYGNGLFTILGYHDTATSYAELFIGTNSASTFTGTAKLYGYRD